MRLTPFLLLGLVATAMAQSDVAAILRAPAERLSAVRLPVGHRAVTLGTENSPNMLMLFGLSMGGGSQDDTTELTLALVGSVWVQPDEFAELIEGKRPRIKGYAYDLAGSMVGGRSESAPDPIFTPIWIEGGRTLAWQPRPTLTRERLIAAFPSPESVPRLAKVETELKAIHTAGKMFSADNKGARPDSPASLKKYLASSIDLSKYRMSTINFGSNTANVTGGADLGRDSLYPTWAEAKQGAEGRRGLLSSDGRITFISERDWRNRYEGQFAPRPPSSPPPVGMAQKPARKKG